MNLYNKFFYVFYSWAKNKKRLSPYFEAAIIVTIHHLLIGMLLFYMLVKFTSVGPDQLLHPLWINLAIIIMLAAGLHYVLVAPEKAFEQIQDFGEIESAPGSFRAFSWLWFVIVVIVSVVFPLMNDGVFLDD